MTQGKIPPKWAQDLTIAYPAAKWPQNYFNMLIRFSDQRNFSPTVIQAGVDDWIMNNTKAFAAPTPGEFVASCEKARSIIEADKLEEDRNLRRIEKASATSANALRKMATRRCEVLQKFYDSGDISTLQEFAFLAECAGYKFVSDSMHGRIKRIHAATFLDFVAAIRPEATPAEREAVAV